MDSKLYMTEKLLTLLSKTPGYSKDNPLIEYINVFNEIVGMDQQLTINFAQRLGFDISIYRYINIKDITLREVMYYEMLGYIKYYENQRKKLRLPTTKKLINITDAQFEVLYKKLYKDVNYEKKYHKTRLSIMTDYIMYALKGSSSEGRDSEGHDH